MVGSRSMAITVSAAMMLLAGSAFADTIKYTAALKATTEVPATTSQGTGTVDATYDTVTKKLTWTVNYTGLTGAATAAHFHSPASPTENAPPTVPLAGDLKSPIKGEATLTDAQAKDLADGKMYFNIHTAANAGGEIRGQVAVSK
jgi:Cu/Zn superoxide dismutase